MVLLNQENRLLTGSADSELRAWDIQYIEEVRRYHSCWITVLAELHFSTVLNDLCGLRELTLISF